MTELKDSRFTISIHALREEGDGTPKCSSTASRRFLSTPSARRATRNYVAPRLTELFLSTPSARRATLVHLEWVVGPEDFYPRPPRGGRPPPLPLRCRTWKNFYPRPPRGGRPSDTGVQDHPEQFLSTPSVRRATRTTMGKLLELLISIHALREEGDMQTQTAAGLGNEFLSTPSARRATPAEREENHPKTFLSTPSARRATWASARNDCSA